MKREEPSSKYTKVQNELLPLIELEDSFQPGEIRSVAGADLAYWCTGGSTQAICSILVIDYHTREVIEKVYCVGKIPVPYMPGFLAFRELPLILDTAKKLENPPDLYLFDGNGYLHQRHMGIATHGALCLHRPSIGVAKNLLLFKGLDYSPPENIKGASSDVLCNNEVCGRALRTREGAKPVFVSCGNWVALDTAIEIVMNLVTEESRLPIPIRLADLHGRAMRKQLIMQ